ncbi:MAG: hypothetical protein GY809_30365, partial [Planctomycetes bacterium]|nr:hypothetical protein [Planctomycetota bacterium]
AGLQEVWVTWTACDELGACNGVWESVDLSQDPVESTLWTGALPLGALPAGEVQFMVQAVNGIGLVSLATNKGAYYVVGINPGAPTTPPGDITPAPADATTLTLLSPPTSGLYGTDVTFTALLTSEGLPLADRLVEIGLTTQRMTLRTDVNGEVTAVLTLINEPTTDIIRASYAGELGFEPS